MKSKQDPRKIMNLATGVLTSGAFVVVALALVAQGCSSSSSNNAATGGSTGAGTGGASSTGGASATSTGGASAAGTGGVSSDGTGGSTVAGTGGATTVGTGGSTVAGTGGAGGGAALPLCVSQVKAQPCLTPTDACSKNCGPKSADNMTIGSKTLTCTSGAYGEGLCTFPAADYTCFKVSATTAMCPAATASGGACTVAPCMPCSGYTDSTLAPKVGYCHCVNSKWSCGSVKEWPCKADGTGSTSPGGTGC